MDLTSLLVDRPDEGVFRVHRSTMTSAEILAQEREQIFLRTWLYLGHESEIPNAGDYRRRTVAGCPLFMVRGADGQVRAFFNTCTHRGAQICRRDAGNAETFQCFYHAWTFNNQGDLVGVPDQEGYSGAFDPARFGLKPPPRVEGYRGLYFISFDPDVEDLQSYLGDAKEVIDQSLDSAEVLGGWAVMKGTVQYSIRANWKLLIENSVDNYHVAPVHQTYFDYLSRRRRAAGLQQMTRQEQRVLSRGLALSGRHGGVMMPTVGRAIANPSPLWSEDAQRECLRVRDLLIARYGEQRGRQMAEYSRFVVVFPNLVIQDTASGFRFRQIWPLAPDHMEIVQWELAPREERADLHACRMEFSLTFLGPGGFATPDDVEALESCQKGYRAPWVEWSELSRGMHRDQPVDDDELQIRTFWRQWFAMMQGQRHAPVVEERPPAPLSEARSA